jgi:NDP-sugar pyrophosphorylase family protein
MINIVIPMAGKGTRFVEAGYTIDKPFLPVGNKTMIEAVTENVTPQQDKRIIYIAAPTISKEQESLLDRSRGTPGVTHFAIEPTEGAACSVLLVEDLIDNDDPLIIANSDQLVDWDMQDFLLGAQDFDAYILTLTTTEPKYSFAEIVANGEHIPVDRDMAYSLDFEVLRTAEKNPISSFGTVGIYYFKKGSDFVKAAERMIEDNDRFNGEFYVCPAFNYLPRTKKIGHYNLPASDCHFLGAPKEYEEYISNLSKEK